MLCRIKERIQNIDEKKMGKKWKYIFGMFGNAKENSKGIAVHVEIFPVYFYWGLSAR